MFTDADFSDSDISAKAAHFLHEKAMLHWLDSAPRKVKRAVETLIEACQATLGVRHQNSSASVRNVCLDRVFEDPNHRTE